MGYTEEFATNAVLSLLLQFKFHGLKKKKKSEFFSLNPYPLIREEGKDLIVPNFVNPLIKPPLIPTTSLHTAKT